MLFKMAALMVSILPVIGTRHTSGVGLGDPPSPLSVAHWYFFISAFYNYLNIVRILLKIALNNYY